jgi:type IV pilus assembly protein PilF
MRHERFMVPVLLVALAALPGCGASSKKSDIFTPVPGREEAAAASRPMSTRSSSRPSRSSRADEPDLEEAAKLNVSLGQAYLAKGQLELAMDKLKKAVELNPRSSDAHTLLGVLYEQINKDANAEQHYMTARKLTPEAGPSNNNLGRFLCARGRFADADKYFHVALADPFYKNPETALVNRAACAMRWGRKDIAEDSLRKALQLVPDNAVALLQMAQLSFDQGEFMRARAFLERHLSATPAAPDTLMLGFQIESRLGDRRAVDNYRRRLLAELPDSEQATLAAKAPRTP